MRYITWLRNHAMAIDLTQVEFDTPFLSTLLVITINKSFSSHSVNSKADCIISHSGVEFPCTISVLTPCSLTKKMILLNLLIIL